MMQTATRPTAIGREKIVNNRAPKEIALAVLGLLFVISGIGGIILGGTPAQAGWWLVVVGIIMSSVGLAALRTRRPV